MGLIKKWLRKTLKRNSTEAAKTGPTLNKKQDKKKLNTDLQENITKIRKDLGFSSDIICKELTLRMVNNRKAVFIYTEGLVDASILQQVMESLMVEPSPSRQSDKKEFYQNQPLHFIKEYSTTLGNVDYVETYDTLYTAILSGDTVILVNGSAQGLIIYTKGGKGRDVEEPTVQTVIRGPREGFTESLQTNIALIRRKIKSTDLWLEKKTIGSVTKTNIGIMYINGIVNKEIVNEVHKRLDRIDIDSILESSYIEEMIQDETYTPFPTVFNSERPDTVASGLLEGRVAILVDGTPFVLLVPALFIHFYQSSEDYYQRADIATLLRLLRFFTLFIALLSPSLYIAITTFHQEMLPTPLLISLASQREGVPFPAFFEALMMEISFEILREAGIRLPKAVGQAVSIVGALVIGQAAVEAGLVSAAMVIVVAVTAISNFVFPAYSMAISIRILRFGLILLATSFGLFGIMVGLVIIVLHLCSLRSFGIPYMAPMAPFNLVDQKDTFFRFPHWGLFSRPRLVSQRNIIREDKKPMVRSRDDNQGREK